jgi:hypothetical protein
MNLGNLIGLAVEVNPIYQGQPLSSAVDRFLREKGFVLGRLLEQALRSIPPRHDRTGPPPPEHSVDNAAAAALAPDPLRLAQRFDQVSARYPRESPPAAPPAGQLTALSPDTQSPLPTDAGRP